MVCFLYNVITEVMSDAGVHNAFVLVRVAAMFGLSSLIWCFAGATTGELAVLARHSTSFDVLAVHFEPLSGRHLAVTGLRCVQARCFPLDS